LHLGEWGSFKNVSQTYPLLYSVLTQQLGTTPENFWNNVFNKRRAAYSSIYKKASNIVPLDNGVFSGYGQTQSNQIGDAFKNAAASAGAAATGILQKMKDTLINPSATNAIISIIGGSLLKVPMQYSVAQIAPAASDWNDWGEQNPFKNGFPPSIGIWNTNTGGVDNGSIIDVINPNNPTANGNNTALLAAAGLGLFMLKKKGAI